MIPTGPAIVEPAPGSITLTDAPSAADFVAIFRGLDDSTAPVAGHARLQPLVVLLRDESGAAIGGLWGRTLYSWLTIEMLFVPAPMRGRGVGSALVRTAEAEARARGCIGLQVSTFDFQAPLFYHRRGFTVFGMQQDHPPGHSTFYFCKRLDRAPLPAA